MRFQLKGNLYDTVNNYLQYRKSVSRSASSQLLYRLSYCDPAASSLLAIIEKIPVQGFNCKEAAVRVAIHLSSETPTDSKQQRVVLLKEAPCAQQEDSEMNASPHPYHLCDVH
jgi:hypothetical protein